MARHDSLALFSLLCLVSTPLYGIWAFNFPKPHYHHQQSVEGSGGKTDTDKLVYEYMLKACINPALCGTCATVCFAALIFDPALIPACIALCIASPPPRESA